MALRFQAQPTYDALTTAPSLLALPPRTRCKMTEIMGCVNLCVVVMIRISSAGSWDMGEVMGVNGLLGELMGREVMGESDLWDVK